MVRKVKEITLNKEYLKSEKLKDVGHRKILSWKQQHFGSCTKKELPFSKSNSLSSTVTHSRLLSKKNKK